jgi:hypothetical protein
MRLYLFIDHDWPATDTSPRDIVELVAPSIVTLHSRTHEPSQRLGTELLARGGVDVEVTPLQGIPTAPKVGLAAVCAAGHGELSHNAQGAKLRLHRAPTAIVRPRAGSLYDRVDAWVRFAEQSDLEIIMAMMRGLYVAFPALHDVIRATAAAISLAQKATTSTTLTAAWMDLETTRIAHPVLAPWLAGPEKMLRTWVEGFAG